MDAMQFLEHFNFHLLENLFIFAHIIKFVIFEFAILHYVFMVTLCIQENVHTYRGK